MGPALSWLLIGFLALGFCGPFIYFLAPKSRPWLIRFGLALSVSAIALLPGAFKLYPMFHGPGEPLWGAEHLWHNLEYLGRGVAGFLAGLLIAMRLHR